MGCIVVGGVARQQSVLLRTTAIVATGLRNTLLCRFHHLLVFAPAVLEPDLNLQHTERMVPVTVTSCLLDYELQYSVCLRYCNSTLERGLGVEWRGYGRDMIMGNNYEHLFKNSQVIL